MDLGAPSGIKRHLNRRVVWQALQDLHHQFVQARCMDSAAALTLATLFALVPMITVLYRAFALLPEAQQLGQRIEHWLFRHLLPTSGQEVQDYLGYFAEQARQLTGLSAVILILTALLMLHRVQQAFNRIWHSDVAQRSWQHHLRYWLVLGLSPLLLVAGVAMSSYLLSWHWFALPSVPGLFAIFPLLAGMLAFTLMNRVMAAVSVSWTCAGIGGGCTALAFELAKYSFALFMQHFPSYQLVYGAFAALPLLISWVYLSWLIILMGALLTRRLALTINHGTDLAA